MPKLKEYHPSLEAPGLIGIWTGSLTGSKMGKRSCAKKIICLFSLMLLSSCGTQMIQVLENCDEGQDFSLFAKCVKSTYAREGRSPNSSIVRVFYANLDEIEEAYRQNRLTSTQARSQTLNAYMQTIDASNAASSRAMGGALQNYGNTVYGQRPQQPTVTNCKQTPDMYGNISSGSGIRCTTQ